MTNDTLMHITVSISSIIYAITAIGKTLYESKLSKSKEEFELTKEGVHLIYITYVRDVKRRGEWDSVNKEYARQKVVDFVRRNTSCWCRCFYVPNGRIRSWITEIVNNKKHKKIRLVEFSSDHQL
jgi:hypothetical protein